MKSAMERQLQALRQRYITAEAHLEKQIGYGTAWYATWQGIWHNQEAGFPEELEKFLALALLASRLPERT
jgi:hypothetical protein